MNNKHILSFVVFIILTLALTACSVGSLGKDVTTISASGTVDADTIRIAPELSGKVISETVKKGDIVKSGDTLFKLDDVLLQAQRGQAEAALMTTQSAATTTQDAVASVQAQYDATFTAARAQQGASRLIDWMNREPGKFDQPLWYFSRSEQIAAAREQVDKAQQALQKSQSDYDTVVQDLSNAHFVTAENRVSDARIAYLIAKAVRDHAQATGGKVDPNSIKLDVPAYYPAYKMKIAIAKDLSGDSDVLDNAKDALDDAESELEDAQDTYDSLLDTDAADRVKEARAAISVAQERYEVALDTLNRLQTGEYSPQVKIASAALDQAKATADQAQNAVAQAEANLATIDAQISKLIVSSPISGIVLSNPVKTGETVAAGATVLEIGNLDEVSLTVYVTENQVGKVKVGDQASVTVDTFPNETFKGEVVNIADEAEFTPRNIQTAESRSTTVYAVEIRLPNTDYKLKPGMPADAKITVGQ